jgi:hypothetical protein
VAFHVSGVTRRSVARRLGERELAKHRRRIKPAPRHEREPHSSITSMASYPADDTSFDEKPHQEHVEHSIEPVPADAEDLHLTAQEEKALLRRIDLKVLPLVTGE